MNDSLSVIKTIDNVSEIFLMWEYQDWLNLFICLSKLRLESDNTDNRMAATP